MWKKILGIDLGDQWIKIVELKQKGKSWTIRNATKIETPEWAIKDGQIMNTYAIYDGLKEQFEVMGIKAKKVCVRISSKQILTKYVPLQSHSLREAKKVIKVRKQEYFHVEGDYVIDAMITGEKRGQELGAFMVAVPHHVVEPITSLIESLRLQLVNISIPSYNYSKQFASETALVIDMGWANSSVSLVDKGICKLVKQLDFGMNQLQEALEEEFGKGEKEDVLRFYEKYLMIHSEVSVDSPDFMGNYVSAIVIEEMEEKLWTELQKILTFYEGVSGQSHIDKVYLTGDCGQIKGLKEYFEAQIGVETDFFVPDLDFEPRGYRRVKQDIPSYANILCLAAISA